MQKIAIIGTGISGLGAALMLEKTHAITVYEKNETAGGHSRTVDVTLDGKTFPVDTGFIVFNHRNYPHLTKMFHHLQVATSRSDMSFGASIGNGFLEYGSKGLFAQKRNLFRPQYWRMLADILRFNASARPEDVADPSLSLRAYLEQKGVGDWFARYYLQAMGAAIWSCSVETILDFPAATFLRFFANHGLLSVNDHPQWYTVKGGSRAYVGKIAGILGDRLRSACGVTKVVRNGAGWDVIDSTGCKQTYDQVVFACHADQALAMLHNPPEGIAQVLASFRYQENTAVLHTDTSFMAKHKGCWTSWMYLSETDIDRNESVSLSYWMNNLQPLPTSHPVFVTLNPGREPAAAKVYDRHVFTHPIFDRAAIEAQSAIPDIQGRDGLWFCGAYQRYGFHEDGLLSAVNVVERMGGRPPWG